MAPRLPGKHRLGRPRAVDLRAIFNAILYIARSGCQWRQLPRDFPPFTTVPHYPRRLRGGRRAQGNGSGAKLDCAERKKVIALAQRREVDAILVTELSRWAAALSIRHRHERPDLRPVDTAWPHDGNDHRRGRRV